MAGICFSLFLDGSFFGGGRGGGEAGEGGGESCHYFLQQLKFKAKKKKKKVDGGDLTEIVQHRSADRTAKGFKK